MNMANTDITYCNGKGCILRSQCRRYQDGQRIIANHNGDTNQRLAIGVGDDTSDIVLCHRCATYEEQGCR